MLNRLSRLHLCIYSFICIYKTIVVKGKEAINLKGSRETCKGLEVEKGMKMILIQYTYMKLKVIDLFFFKKKEKRNLPKVTQKMYAK